LEVTGTTVEIGGELRYVSLDRDITERKRREREYEQIFNGVQDAIIVMDPETLDILDANEAYLDMVGYDDLESVQEQGVEGLSVTTEGYTVDEGKRIHRRVAETGEPEVVEWQAETQGGERRWLEIKVAPAVIRGDEVNVAVHRDVTERRRTKRRLRAIIERIDEAIYFSRADEITNPSLHPDDLSAGYEHIWGQPLEEIFANNEGGFFDTIHPEEKDEFETFIEELGDDIEDGTEADRYSREYRIERPDGEIRWIRSDFYPTEWDTGPLRIVIVSRDITDRKEREQRIASFHDATRKLTTADSREGACRQAVTAAEQVLGLPVVSAHLYTEDTGKLDPVACTSRLEKLNRDLPSFGPGDSLPWQVYVEGEAVTSIESETEIYKSSVSESEIILPLGSHGVMLVGASTEALDSEDVELTQVLAATLEAALNHVAGERVLAEREEELRQHQKRAEQLERLNAIIRDIEQATVEQTSRAAIEEAVCERLIDVDPHQFVWVGEPSIREDELIPRTGVGGKESYIDSLTIDLEAGAGAHPAVRAFQDGTSKMVKNVATDATKGEWRKTALRHGIQSVVAAPISYEDTIHGILTVASDEPQAFDESIQNVFEELGRSIGYAITVTEREESLESERTIELEFSVSDEGLFFVRGSEVESCHLRLERTIRRSGGSFSTFYLVEGGDPDRLVELATTALNVESAQVVSANEADKTGLIEVTTPTWFGSEFTDQGAVVREASATDGDGAVVIETPQEADVRTIAERFQEHYPETEVAAKRQRERTTRSLFEVQDILQDELTDRQWEALQTAYSAGYFAWPRESSGEEVAALLDVTQPTFNKHIRLAEQIAIEILMERDHPKSKGEG
jgi:PAS domain S-box-containing protein